MKKAKKTIKKILKLLGVYKETPISNDYTFNDQKGQISFLFNHVFDYERNGLMKNGFFIDLACADGVTINNTFFMEKYLNWNGLLFEPNPNFKKSIENNRTSPLISKCVSDKPGKKVKFRIDNGMLGGIVSEQTDNNYEFRSNELKSAEIIELVTTTLEEELINFNAPNLIDYMSLDVEGAEYEILKNFPFNKFKFKSISIERPNKDLDLLLDKNSYRQVAHLDYDVIYVHEDFISDINFEPNTRFKFTPRKNW
jgi:FkbM family methyltransferase